MTMLKIKLIRLKNLFKYGWRHAQQISKETGKSQISVFRDIVACYQRYRLFSNKYYEMKFWTLSEDERERLGNICREEAIKKDAWVKDFYENHDFFLKYGSLKYNRHSLAIKRGDAYTKRYNAGDNFAVQNNVRIYREHSLCGKIKIGNNVLICRNSTIDYSGDLIINDNVGISQGVIIETHSHQRGKFNINNETNVIPMPLEIKDNVKIGANAIILETTGSIGRFASIGAGSVIRKAVPPYAIVMGNPAKIVGFYLTPQHMKAFEEKNYPPDQRTSFEEYSNVYNEFFRTKFENITHYNSMLT